MFLAKYTFLGAGMYLGGDSFLRSVDNLSFIDLSIEDKSSSYWSGSGFLRCISCCFMSFSFMISLTLSSSVF